MPLTELRKLANKVERLYSRLDTLNTKFIEKGRLNCPRGCGLCCLGQQISASPLEFLPLALHFYDQGIIEEKYWFYQNNASHTCLLYHHQDHVAGHCGHYPYRALVCRLFGNSAVPDKVGQKRYLGCSILKEQTRGSVDFNTTLNRFAPLSTDFYFQLSTLHPQYGSESKPINHALVESLGIVANHAIKLQRRSSSSE
jgi:uncharacterized protein